MIVNYSTYLLTKCFIEWNIFEPMTIIFNEDLCVPKCDTCKRTLEFLPYRIVNIRDKNFKNRVLYFHYFFPCWDMDYLMQAYDGCKIISAGFSFDSEVLEKPLLVRNMEKNTDLWI